MINKLVVLVAIFAATLELVAQDDHNHQNEVLSGLVVEIDQKGKEQPVIGANIYWLEDETGAVATNKKGKFAIPFQNESGKIVVSYVGYTSDTITVLEPHQLLKVTLSGAVDLEGVTISTNVRTTSIAFLAPQQLSTMGEEELFKAACCNLSESFETNPSVDVSFTDAVTGIRQIQMLGLSGPYIQVTREIMPDVRGLAANTGLTYTPGTWVESIQLAKGTGSVVNGYEGIAGQVNVELKKPEHSEILFLNLYKNAMGRNEVNLNVATKVAKGLWTGFLLHGATRMKRHDMNDDGFMDNPETTNLIGMNRWKFQTGTIEGQLGVKLTHSDLLGGQLDYDQHNVGLESPWGYKSKVRRQEIFTKTGKVFRTKANTSLGLQLYALNHAQEDRFGEVDYVGNQQTFHGNLLFNGLFGTTNHAYKLGVSYLYDDYAVSLFKPMLVSLSDSANLELNFLEQSRQEQVIGGFFEYTLSPVDHFNVVAGLRLDHHNLFGWQFNPRIHARYAFTDNTVLRASAGRGFRVANVLAENTSIMTTNRVLQIDGNQFDTWTYRPEVAWNFGVNVTHSFVLDYREGVISADFYHTKMLQQAILNRETPGDISVDVLDGISFANSAQVQLDYELLKRLDLRLAYRMYDVQMTYDDLVLDKPLLAKHRAFLNVGYKTLSRWTIDGTVQWQGAKRIPGAEQFPEEFRIDALTPSYFLVNSQVTKRFGKEFDWYIGCENMLNFRQDNAIISADDPGNRFFDPSLIWGPFFGRNIYTGIRWKIPKKEADKH